MSSAPTLSVNETSNDLLTQRISSKFEWFVGAVVILGLVGIRIYFMSHAGGLWRDEVHSVDVARNHQFPLWQDSFPILWVTFLRAWIFVCGDSDDTSMRLAGLFWSLILLGTAVWAAQGRSRAVPWATLILFGMSPIVTTYGTEVRGYAMGASALFWMLGLMQRWLLRPTGRGGILLVIASLVAVQAAYANSFLLLAASLSAGILCVMEKRWRALLFLLANGIVCAVTVSPYILVILPLLTGDWVVVLRQDFPVGRYVNQMMYSFGAGGVLPFLAWGVLACCAGFGVKQRYYRRVEDEKSTNTAPCGPPGALEIMQLVFGTLLIIGYLKWLNVYSAEWYYLPVLALWAFCLDSMIATWTQRSASSSVRLGIAILLAASQIPITWDAANVRLTNVDIVSKAVTEMATDKDLVIVSPWIYGIPVQRYYHGAAPWICIPKVSKTEVPGVMIHADGYRAVMATMMSENPLAAELAQIRETLRRGGRVFVMGNVTMPQKGDIVLEMPVAPSSQYGWGYEAYRTLWTQKIGLELLAHSKEIRLLPINNQQPVNRYEDSQLYVVEGLLDDSVK